MIVFFDSEVVQRVGWTLVHSLWQISIIVAVTAMLCGWINGKRANTRYIVNCAGLLACVMVPAITLMTIELPTRSEARPTVANVATNILPASAVAVPPLSSPPLQAPMVNESVTASPESVSSGDRTDLIASAESSLFGRFSAWVNPCLPTVFCLWIVGVMILVMRPVASIFFSRKLKRQGRSIVPEWVAKMVQDVCQELKISPAVTIAQSTLVQVPCVVGYFKPLILLPVSALTGLNPAELRTIIVHELAHVRRHDYLVSLLQTVVESLLFFHPLVWWLSSAVRIERENCCDDVVLGSCDDRSQYVRALMQIEVSHQPGLTVCANGGSLVQRVRRIVGQQNQRPGNTWLASLFVVVLLAILPIGRPASLSAVEPDNNGDAAAAATDSITVKVVDANGKPIANAQVESEIDKAKTLAQTNERGLARVHLPDQTPAIFTIRATGGFVPLMATWRNGEDNEPDPIPAEIVFHTEPGKPLSGRVTDRDGNPIAGATIKPSNFGLVVLFAKRVQSFWDADTVTTDENGQWSVERVPSTLDRFDATISHPRFANDFIRFALRGPKAEKEHVSTLRSGVNVGGTVTDAFGKPLAGTDVMLSPKYATPGSWTARTNEAGEYRFTNVKPDEVRVTVATQDFVPQSTQRVDLDQNTEIDFELRKGTPLTLRFVDADDNPVEGVRVNITHWINGISLQKFENLAPQASDANGTWEWKHPPQGRLGYSFKKRGYLSHRYLNLETRDEPYQYVMNPVLNVSGSVTDKKTGKPIEAFKIIRGNYPTYGIFGSDVDDAEVGIAWDRYGGTPMRNGQYNLRIANSYKKHYVKIEADGYRPAASPAFMDDGGELTFDFQLEPSEEIKGQVVDQEGTPIPGAEVHCIIPGPRTEVRNNFVEEAASIKAVTDDDGNFALPEQVQDFAIMVIADQGYAYTLQHEFNNAKQQIKVSRWATVRGKCMIGDKPATGMEVSLMVEYDDRIPKNLRATQWSRATVQEDGVYEIKRVPPNTVCNVSRIVQIPRKAGGSIGGHSHTQRVTTKPTRVSRANLGGVGRPVIGSVKLPDHSKRQVNDWNNGISMIHPINKDHPHFAQTYPFGINEDRTFRVEDLPAGDYRLTIFATDMHASSVNFEIGRIEKTFTIPEIDGGQSNEPLDLKVLEVTLKD